MSSRRKNDVNIAVRKKRDFFEKGQKIAKRADKASKLNESKTIWFEDPKDLLKFLSENKFDLISLIRDKPRSISELAKASHRNRASVTRDVNVLEEFGLVKSEMAVNAGHGRVRIVKPATNDAVILQIRF